MLFSKMIRATALVGLVMSAVAVPSYKLKLAQGACYGSAIVLGCNAIEHSTNWVKLVCGTTLMTAGVYSLFYALNERPRGTTPAERRLKKDARHRRDYAWAYQNLPTAQEYAAARNQAVRN
jgi:hypothetical protein